MTRSPFAETPAQVGGYCLLREVGRGTSAVVWEAEHVALKKRVAVKVLHAERAENEVLAARFVREGRAAARVRHPHVVDVLDVGEHEGRPYLVMELVEGLTLAPLTREALSPQRLLDYMLPVLAAVQHAHDCGVLHRDLKPANILIGRDRHGDAMPKVADFGISKLTDEPIATTVTEDGALVGTLAYMAPEQVRSPRSVDARADQYALAVMLYQGATGELPYVADTAYELLEAIAKGALRSPRELRPDLPAAFGDALVRAMSVAREERFASVRDLARALLPFASGRAWTAFARDFEIPTETKADAVIESTCDEAARDVETANPLAVDVRSHRGAARAARWVAVVGAGALIAGGLALAPRLMRREARIAAPDPASASPAPSARAEPAVPFAQPVIAMPLAAEASTASAVTASPSLSPSPPTARAGTRSAGVNAVASPAARAPRAKETDAGTAPSASAQRYELGDHDAPIVE